MSFKLALICVAVAITAHIIVINVSCSSLNQKLGNSVNVREKIKYDSKKKPKNEGEFTYRLPNDTRPLNYSLTFVTNIENNTSSDQFKYSGTMFMWIKVLKPTDTITMHGVGFSVRASKLKKSIIEIVEWADDEQPKFQARDFLTFKTKERLEVNREYTLWISFESELREDQKGIYRANYIQENERKWLVISNFQPTFARLAFPCYDEPQIRVPMSLSINHGREHYAAGTTPIDRINYL